jgi:hypothetical protein
MKRFTSDRTKARKNKDGVLVKLLLACLFVFFRVSYNSYSDYRVIALYRIQLLPS